MPNYWKEPSGRPANLDIGFRFQLNELVSAVKAEIRAAMPSGSGRLASAFRLGPNDISVNGKGDGVTIRVSDPKAAVYARLKDRGGEIPDRRARAAQYMRFEAGGEIVFARFAKGYKVPGTGYIAAALRAWIPSIKVHWGKSGRA